MEHARKHPKVPKLRGLPTSRTGALILALVCALVATGVIVVAINNYRKSVNATVRQETVLVATKTITKGTSADAASAQQLFRPTLVLNKNMTAGAIGDAGILRGRVATRDIIAGEQITATDFGVAGGIPAQLQPNQRAVSVTLDASHGLIGSLSAGDRVDVYGDFQVQGQAGQTTSVTRLLIPNALVLKPGVAAGAGIGASGASGATVLLAISNEQAGPLAYASDNGKVWLVLRPTNGANASDSLTSLNSILFGGKSIPQSGALQLGATSTGSGSATSGGKP